MKAWLWSKKLYVLHGAVIAIVFINPSVNTLLAAHPGQSAIFGLAWGWVLHWAEGRAKQPWA